MKGRLPQGNEKSRDMLQLLQLTNFRFYCNHHSIKVPAPGNNWIDKPKLLQLGDGTALFHYDIRMLVMHQMSHHGFFKSGLP